MLIHPHFKGDNEESPAVVFRATTIANELEDQLFITSLHDDELVTLTTHQKKRIAESIAEADREGYLL